jgi:hypothetical protein
MRLVLDEFLIDLVSANSFSSPAPGEKSQEVALKLARVVVDVRGCMLSDNEHLANVAFRQRVLLESILVSVNVEPSAIYDNTYI